VNKLRNHRALSSYACAKLLFLDHCESLVFVRASPCVPGSPCVSVRAIFPNESLWGKEGIFASRHSVINYARLKKTWIRTKLAHFPNLPSQFDPFGAINKGHNNPNSTRILSRNSNSSFHDRLCHGLIVNPPSGGFSFVFHTQCILKHNQKSRQKIQL
jgi:hypothetical protein